MKQTEKSRYAALNSIAFLARDMARFTPLLPVYLAIEMVFSVISPILALYVPKVAIDLVASGASARQCLLRLVGIGLAMTLSRALAGMAGRGKYFMYNGMRPYYHDKLFMQWLDCDYRLIETPEGQTRYQRAVGSIRSGDWSGTSRLTVAALDLVVACASFIIYSGILSRLNAFIILALIALSLVNLFCVRRAQKYEYAHKDEQARFGKQMDYIERVSDDGRWGKDIRLYGMSRWLLAAREALLLAYMKLNRGIQKRYFTAGAVNALTLLFRDALAYGYLIAAVAAGKIGAGDFALFFGAITGFSGFVGRLIGDINQINGANLQMNDLRAFLNNADAPDPAQPASLPPLNALSIEFDHVRFAYEKDGAPVLDDFCLSIRAGEKIALVGVNGAGKTTLVKLLCGFYAPDSGHIRIGGVDITRFRKKDLYSLFSPVFQDLFLLPTTVAENVSMKRMEETDVGRAEACLEQAGLLEAIRRYPDGVKSYMLHSVNDGIVLSGGQQQKLFMARALYKDAPILILDEPTAALDPIAESETYESFHALSSGKTAIYISHRLASTRFCDRIVFLKDGRVAESGTHEALVSQNGEYAGMYALQSHYYRQKEAAQNA